MDCSSHLLLTGGTGFFGRSLLRTWLDQCSAGAPCPTVTILTREPGAFFARYHEFAGQPWLGAHAGDITDKQTLPHKTKFTHILHAAADSTLGARLTPLQRYDQIVSGTRNLLDLAVECDAQRFLLTSSGAVYGPQPPEIDCITEDSHRIPDPLDPENTYGIAKRAAEHLCALYGQNYGLHTVITRGFAFVGPDLPLDAHFAIGNFIRDALWRDEISVAGDGTALRSYLDQRDLATWLITMLDRGLPGRAYNVGSDQAVSIAELANIVRDLLAPGKPVLIRGNSQKSGGRNRYIPSIQRARDELGLSIRIPLRLAILATADALTRNG